MVGGGERVHLEQYCISGFPDNMGGGNWRSAEIPDRAGSHHTGRPYAARPSTSTCTPRHAVLSSTSPDKTKISGEADVMSGRIFNHLKFKVQPLIPHSLGVCVCVCMSVCRSVCECV